MDLKTIFIVLTIVFLLMFMSAKKETKNFSIEEFRSKDGADVPSKYVSNVLKLMQNLEVLRKYLGDKPISISSGYRSPSHNARVGGATNSRHMKGMAADIVVEGVSPQNVQGAIRKLMSEGKMHKGGLGVYKNFTHYDIGKYRTWS